MIFPLVENWKKGILAAQRLAPLIDTIYLLNVTVTFTRLRTETPKIYRTQLIADQAPSNVVILCCFVNDLPQTFVQGYLLSYIKTLILFILPKTERPLQYNSGVMIFQILAPCVLGTQNTIRLLPPILFPNQVKVGCKSANILR